MFKNAAKIKEIVWEDWLNEYVLNYFIKSINILARFRKKSLMIAITEWKSKKEYTECVGKITRIYKAWDWGLGEK